MITYQSKLLGKARKEVPGDTDSVSHQLLARAGFIDQLASGIFSLLPLGYLVSDHIERVIREEMLGIDAAELLLPSLQPASLWAESGRLDTMDPPLFRVIDRHKKELVLGSTHEEVMTDLARKHVESYKDLPFACFQIQTKFRNEMRATGGLLRVREFRMKDLYSFHQTQEELEAYYVRVREAYITIFKRCGLVPYVVEADSGTIGGAVSQEFSVESEAGEDSVAVCSSCGHAVNVEIVGDTTSCPQCSAALEIKSCIENGHIFQLGTTYSEKMGAFFNDKDGNRHPIVMGCYGIGIGRLLAVVVETHHDDRGMIWPSDISPFAIHLTPLQSTVAASARKIAERIGEYTSVLFDDRDLSAGEKLAESDLIGITIRIIVSEKTEEKNSIEAVNRADGTSVVISVDDFIKTLA